MRERRVHLERLLRGLHLLLLREVLDRAHVVQPVRELDRDHARVVGHRDDHLPVVLRLRLLAALELDPRQLRDALDQLCNLVAELVLDLVELDARVLDRVVQQRCRDRLLVEAELGTVLGDVPRMRMNSSPEPPHLSLVRVRGDQERPDQELPVGRRVVRRHRIQQLVDQVLVLLTDLDYCHLFSVLGGLAFKGSADQVLKLDGYAQIPPTPTRGAGDPLILALFAK